MVRVAVPSSVAPDVVADALWSHGPASVLEDGDDLVAGFASEAAASRAAAGIEWSATVEVVEDDSWQDAWKAHAEPVRVGDLLVVPSWLEVLRIDPGTAFGSGSHASTQLCLAALTELAPGATLLDVGCGSGILSIAAMRLGAASAVAIDVAAEAIEVTRANAVANGVAVDARHVMIDDVGGTFDVVVANIGAAVLRDMAPALAPRVGEWLVLAGLLDEHVPSVVAAYAAHGLELVDAPVLDTWAAPRLVRPLDAQPGEKTPVVQLNRRKVQ
ncbi:MAG: ribosomal protein methyltransferase [Actinomycetota bacterium]|jgi:ribosomal protein L11 methyltransferase|nr:ribosomal protein methyltransferase [Actinomycetota bacterium]